MASLRMTAPTASAMRSSVRSAKPVLPVRRPVRALAVRAQASLESTAFKVGTVATLSTVASSWMMAGNASAATELATLAASDNRAGIIATLLVPAVGWVAFNILGGLQAQLKQMDDKRKAVPAAVGLGAAATLLFAQQAEASTELATLAASDNRAGIIATLLVPAVGWVAFNILGGLQAQLSQMEAKNK
ncbi:Photosystem II core complex proteins psbY, chloroplastic [Tetrabaena socialis]|uniref:Photosystem II core complex proteins psbY, chloroplastic n=1 Tax=Tetrabaena socialis TaxID=47790 RepID=A0A2J7ZK28_9CHLO|nr:Photosystem II core complex proteins psbY, chloroplastic [Tetrabaena socialis]|eukprot:PNH00626.1 Photosystem II core complex proteins psbY, chloroplastic [Tetrabaena socialis]